MARIPNFKIDEKIRNLESFENYNGSIHAVRSGERYSIVHWNTVILDYNIAEEKITDLASGYISQTTSTLVGRILRSLPRQAVIDALSALSGYDRNRLERMARLYH